MSFFSMFRKKKEGAETANVKMGGRKKALLYHAWLGNYDQVHRLLSTDVDVNALSEFGTYKESPLGIAAGHNFDYKSNTTGNVDIVQLLLTHPAIDVNKQNSYCQSPLYNACAQGNADIVRLLLERLEIDVNNLGIGNCTWRNKQKYTPLGIARKQLEYFQSLQNKDEELISNYIQIVNDLRDRGAKENSSGGSRLHTRKSKRRNARKTRGRR